MSSDGDDFFSKVGNKFVDYTAQMFTGGFVGYQDGKFGASGVSSDMLKDVTGATAAEEANKLARQQFEEAKAEADAQRVEQQAQTGRDQIRQSQMAAAARSTASSRSANKATASSASGGGLTLGEDEKDFLGL